MGGNKVTTQTAVNVAGNVALPYLTAEGVAKATFSNTSDLQLQSYKSVAFLKDDGSPDRQFFQIPSPDVIAQNVSKNVNVAMYSSASDLVLYDNGPKVHFQDVTGIPNIMCDKQKWMPDPPAQLSLISASTNTRENNRVVCTFGVEFKPDGEAVQSGQILNYKLLNSFESDGKKLSLAIPASAAYTASSVPRLSYTYSSQFWEQHPKGTGYDLIWNEQFQIIDNNLLKPDNAALDVRNLTLVCPIPTTAQPIISGTRKGGAGGAQLLEISLEGQYSDSLQEPANTNPYQQCSLQGNVVYSFASGGTVAKALPANVIYYPKKQSVTVLNITLQPTSPATNPSISSSGQAQQPMATPPNKAVFSLPVGVQPK